MSAAIDFIQFDERMTGEASPDYDDTLNRALKTVVSVSGADEDAFVGFALRPVVAPSVGQFYRATDTDVGASWQTLTAAMVSDLTSASTGITKVGTVNTGVWQGTSIATTYTDAKIKTVTGTANRLTVGGTATDPTFDISAAYVGQTSIVTVGTIVTGVWNGTSIGTAHTDAKVVSITGTASRVSVAGTATVPIIDIDAAYTGQTSIVTLGTVTTGTWQGTSIATGFTDAKIKTVTGTVGTVTISGTATDPIFTISAAYIGQNTITTLGTITTGVWNGTAIATANTIAQLIDLTGTANRITVGGTSTHPTVDISSAYVGQATITTVGTIAAGVWQGTSIATGFTDAKIKTVTGTASRVTIGGTATDPTFDISAAYVGQATITTLGTISTGTWAATAITVDKGGTNLTSFTIGDMIYASGATTLSKLAIGTGAQILVTNGGATAPAWHTLVTADITDLTSATTGITKVGTVTTGVWNAGVIAGTYGGTGVNNGASTITLGGSLTTSGAFALTLTVTAGTNVTLPTTGTLVNSAVTSLASLTSVGGAFAISGAFTGATTGAFSSTLSTSQLTITDTASRIIPGATSLSLRNNANNADNLIVTDAGAITVRSTIAGVTTISGTTATFTNLGGTLSTAAQANVTSVGTLTSLALSGIITRTNTAATTSQVLGATGSTTGATYIRLSNTTGDGFFGVESSTGGILLTGSTAYATVISAATATVLQFGANDTLALTLAKTGTGVASATFTGAVSGITTLDITGAFTGTRGTFVSGSGVIIRNGATDGLQFSQSGANSWVQAALAGANAFAYSNYSTVAFGGAAVSGITTLAIGGALTGATTGAFSSTGTFGGKVAVGQVTVDATYQFYAIVTGGGTSSVAKLRRDEGTALTRGHITFDFSSTLSGSTGADALVAAAGGTGFRFSVDGTTQGLDILAAGTVVITHGAKIDSLQMGAPTGGDKGSGTINVATDIYKNNTAYTNPDYVFELAYTGSVTKFAENAGAAKFVQRGIMSLDQIEDFARKTWQLPGVAEAEGIFERADVILEKIEEAYLHLFDLHKRLKVVEGATA